MNRKYQGRKPFKKTQTYKDQTTYNVEGRPKGDETVHDSLSIKSLRYLPHSTYAMKADPYESALPTSEPYPLLNRFNKLIDAHYKGEDNIDGGNVQQYANSTTSEFLKIFDVIRAKVNINYRYLPMARKFTAVTAGTTLKADVVYWMEILDEDSNPTGRMKVAVDQNDPACPVGEGDYISGSTEATAGKWFISSDENAIGSALIDEVRKSIAEAVSILKGTTFTQMAINQFVVMTDMPMGSAKMENLSAEGYKPVYGYSDITDVLYCMSIYYQLYLQNALSVMNWHNSFRMKQGTMIRNAWNREVPILNGFFGLMNKAAFLNKLDSINLSFEGEYVDTDFMKQMNILSLMPSRRSNAMTDPVLELQVGWTQCTSFQVGVKTSAYSNPTLLYSDTDLEFEVNVSGVTTNMTYWSICDTLRDYLSLEANTNWARKAYSGGVVTTDNDRYNTIMSLFNAVNKAFAIFKPKWADYREALDVVSRTGIINWTKGFRPSIIKDTDGQLFRTLIIDNVFNFLLAGPDTIDYDDATKRWRTWTKWNMYDGVPEYDTRSGGSFLSFAFKNFSGVLTNEQIEYMPQLFEFSSAGPNVVALSRDGVEVVVKGGSANVVTIRNVQVLRRLAPLVSQASETMRVPTVEYDADLSSGHISFLYKELTQIFGVCRVEVSSGVYDYSIDPDILAIYQIEVSDITNMAITYARVNAPFRGTSSTEDLIGFGG